MRRELLFTLLGSALLTTSQTTAEPLQTIVVEMDMLSTAQPVPNFVQRNGKTYTLESIYKDVGIQVSSQVDEVLADLHPDKPYTAAELHSFHIATINKKPVDGSWYIHALVLSRFEDPGTYGYMFQAKRDAVAIFTNEIGSKPDYILRTMAHELGHALNMFHSDGDGDMKCCANEQNSVLTGRSIMNQTRCLADDWSFTFSTKEKAHLMNHPKNRLEPGSDFKFGQCTDHHKGTC